VNPDGKKTYQETQQEAGRKPGAFCKPKSYEADSDGNQPDGKKGIAPEGNPANKTQTQRRPSQPARLLMGRLEKKDEAQDGQHGNLSPSDHGREKERRKRQDREKDQEIETQLTAEEASCHPQKHRHKGKIKEAVGNSSRQKGKAEELEDGGKKVGFEGTHQGLVIKVDGKLPEAGNIVRDVKLNDLISARRDKPNGQETKSQQEKNSGHFA